MGKCEGWKIISPFNECDTIHIIHVSHATTTNYMWVKVYCVTFPRILLQLYLPFYEIVISSHCFVFHKSEKVFPSLLSSTSPFLPFTHINEIKSKSLGFSS